MAKTAVAKKSQTTASPDDSKTTLSLSTKDLPAIKNWEMGKTYHVVLELKQTGRHQSDNEYGMSGKEDRATFQVLNADVYKDPDLEGFGDDEDEESDEDE